jgi:hypothetical protein
MVNGLLTRACIRSVNRCIFGLSPEPAMVEHVKNPNLDGLTELANRDGVDIKPTLLRVMTDLYAQSLCIRSRKRTTTRNLRYV